MKNLKIFAGLFFSLLILSCNKEDVNESEDLAFQEVVFDVSNYTASSQRGSQNLSKAEAVESLIPECSEIDAALVKLTILDAADVATEYTLDLVAINNNTETEPLKLNEGEYRITSFVAYAEDGVTAVWAAPMMGSYYQTLWNLKGVKDLPFTINKFDKIKVNVDVLCYEPFDYQNFGFGWFAFSQTEINTICFFGDICTEFYEQWHTLEGSPYVGQSYNGYDFPAIFSVEVYNAEGVRVNDANMDSNISWQGSGAPLCIEYPNQIGVEETFNYSILVALPDGNWEVIHNGSFADTAEASTSGDGGFGGKDGVFTFGAGCTNADNDLNVSLNKYDFSLPPAPQERLNSGSTPKQLLDSGVPMSELIGLEYQGGLIFWMDAVNGNGLVAAKEDQSSGIPFAINEPYVNGGATQNGIGWGKTNTDLILNSHGAGNYAASVASNYNGGGYTDWFLPSLFEAREMTILFKKGLGNIAPALYWTAKEYSFHEAYFWSFSAEYWNQSSKSSSYRVRAVRAFN
ncbi:DUF1566 domain-containing protein [Christiangramia salexigens]|uniref:DUF1566 domain-containing protein n=1 Tax=Christiangramia salexigens TaxID=1913577 RepID=A0A1L3J5U9_9FLAO|nr:DUF1566 domain-containing protein [Christiangramia salexigens]APG60518.1 hypothetical protein LPB144_08930 [Christiangramia salexigens]